jgi:isochorismate hydrolase
MKEAYFTQENVAALSQKWLDEFGSVNRGSSQPLDIQEAALLILDMQRYFLEPDSHAYVPSGVTIIPILNKLIDSFRERNRPVIATQHINSLDDAGMMDTWWSELITADHPQVEIHGELNIHPDEIVSKTQYNAFYKSKLHSLLEENHVSQLVICGVMTHLCCETTARSGFVKGYQIFFPIDSTATYNQNFHTATLRNLSHGFAVMTTSDKLIEEMKS